MKNPFFSFCDTNFALLSFEMRKYLFLVLCVGLWVSIVDAKASKEKERPNIVWIFVEDMNDWMGCFGDNTVPTPNIDKLLSLLSPLDTTAFVSEA